MKLSGTVIVSEITGLMAGPTVAKSDGVKSTADSMLEMFSNFSETTSTGVSKVSTRHARKTLSLCKVINTGMYRIEELDL